MTDYKYSEFYVNNLELKNEEIIYEKDEIIKDLRLKNIKLLKNEHVLKKKITKKDKKIKEMEAFMENLKNNFDLVKIETKKELDFLKNKLVKKYK